MTHKKLEKIAEEYNLHVSTGNKMLTVWRGDHEVVMRYCVVSNEEKLRKVLQNLEQMWDDDDMFPLGLKVW